jgi:hypothetical protein
MGPPRRSWLRPHAETHARASEATAGRRGRGLKHRISTTRLIRLAMAASLILPAVLFVLASWTSWENLHATARERLVRSLDVEQQDAFKTFELVDLALSQTADLVAGFSIHTAGKSPSSSSRPACPARSHSLIARKVGACSRLDPPAGTS